MSGTEFLWMYFGLVMGVWIWSQFRYRSGGQPPIAPQQLKEEHWAILSGGLRRAAFTVFTRKLQTESIVWNSETKQYEPKDPESTDPTAQLLKNQTVLAKVFESLEQAHRSYEQQLENWGLWLSDRDHQNRRLAVSFPFALLLLLGVGRIILGLTRHRPVGFLCTMMVLTGIIWIYRARTVPRLTKEGRDLLQTYKNDNDHIIRATPEEQLPLAVALGGPFALQGTQHAILVWALAPHSTRLTDNGNGTYNYVSNYGSSDGGISSCSSGGGDSGGSGCGSGCGGCGGGD